jgi:hypothetical protein
LNNLIQCGGDTRSNCFFFRTFEEKEASQANALSQSSKSRADCFGGGWYWNQNSRRVGVGVLLNSAAHQDPKYLDALLECRRNAETNIDETARKIDARVSTQAPWMKSSSSQLTQEKLNLVLNSRSENLIHGVDTEAQENDVVTLTFDPYTSSVDLEGALQSQRDFQSWPPSLPADCKLQLDMLRNMSHYIQGDHGKTRPLLGRRKAVSSR